MSKKRRRKFTVEQKVRILEEARAPNTTVVEVLRRHQLDKTTFYRWERQAKEGAREALEGRVRRNGQAADREIERLEEERGRLITPPLLVPGSSDLARSR